MIIRTGLTISYGYTKAYCMKDFKFKPPFKFPFGFYFICFDVPFHVGYFMILF